MADLGIDDPTGGATFENFPTFDGGLMGGGGGIGALGVQALGGTGGGMGGASPPATGMGLLGGLV